MDDNRSRKLLLHFDGGSRGNPGPAGIGVTLTTPDGTTLYELAEFLGHHTNNFAEYTALIRGVAAAIDLGATELIIRADSQLVVRQIQGQYRVKSPDIRPLYQQAMLLLQKVPNWSISHLYREDNSRADTLANLAMDRRTKIELPTRAAGQK
jgi:ribonuclease HI